MKGSITSALIGLCIISYFPSDSQLVQQTFSFTGSMQSFTVPACVPDITITVRGARGSVNNNSLAAGGMGGQAYGVIAVSPGDVLNVFVGGSNGYNGGAAGGVSGCSQAYGGSGGGASDVRINGIALNNRIIVGAGGGGGGGDRISGCGRGTGGGGGGGYYGGGGGAGWGNANVPTGGTQLAGGAGGLSGTAAYNGVAGSLGNGGAGGAETTSGQAATDFAAPGGAGGGLTGANGLWSVNFTGQGGAGGSSYIGGVTNGSTAAGVNAGNGIVIFDYGFLGNSVVSSLSPTALCQGSSANLGASGMVSYTWSTGSNNASISVSPNVTTTYTVLGTNSVNCVSSAVITVTVSSGVPVLAITSSTNQTCLGKTVTLTATGALLYSWSGGVTNGVSFSPSATSGYTVTGINGCGTSTAATSITVAPLPVTVAASQSIICQGKATTLTAVAAANGYTWQPSNLTQSMAIVSPTSTTIYSVSVSDGTCSGVDNVTITVLPIPTINVVASNSNICLGNSVTLNASGGLSYTWSPGNMSGPNVTVMPAGPTLYTVTGDNSVGCSSSTTQIVLTVTSSTFNVSGMPNYVCPGDPVLLSANGNASGYMWTNGPSGPTHNVNPLVTTVYSVSGSNTTNTCVTTKTIQISVFVPVVNVVSSSSVVCSMNTVVLTASGAENYEWNNSVFGPVNTVTPNISQTYSVTASSTSVGLTCSVTAAIPIQVNPNPTVTASSTRTNICRNEFTDLIGGGATTYSWSTGASGPSVSVTSSLVTIHTFTIYGTDANGCQDDATIQVRVLPCNGIAENVYNQYQIEFYPVPARDEITLRSDIDRELRIVSLTGQEAGRVSLKAGQAHCIKLNGMEKGVYLLTDIRGNLAGKMIVE